MKWYGHSGKLLGTSYRAEDTLPRDPVIPLPGLTQEMWKLPRKAPWENVHGSVAHNRPEGPPHSSEGTHGQIVGFTCHKLPSKEKNKL